MGQLDSFRATGRFGYACKVWIAREIEEHYLGGVYYVWFSERLNPPKPTDPSSNPLEIYRVVDHAVETGAAYDPKIKDLQANILTAINLIIFPEEPRLSRGDRNVPLGRAIEMSPFK